MSKPVILLAIDGEEERAALATQLGAADIVCQCVDRPRDLLTQLERSQPATVIVDISFGGDNTHRLLRSAAPHLNGTPVVFRARRSANELELALEASLRGAGDFLLAPHDHQRLRQIVERAHCYFHEQLASPPAEPQNDFESEGQGDINLEKLLVGTSRAIAKVRAKVQRLAPKGGNLLIHGEAGTGKQLVAKALHDLGPRGCGPWVVFSPASIPEGDTERELFGSRVSEQGGAWVVQQGKLDFAAGGTLYIDELADLEWATQLSLVRWLKRQPTSPQPRGKDPRGVRVIGATCKDPKELLAAGRLSEDLYDHLTQSSILLCPLRERREDVAPLARHFLENTPQSGGCRVEGISDQALNDLVQFSWPGNVGQLLGAIEQMVLSAAGPLLGSEDVPREFRSNGGKRQGKPAVRSRVAAADGSFAITADLTPLQHQERLLIIDALARTGDNVIAAANLLKMGQATVYRKIRLYHIPHVRPRRTPRLKAPK